MSDYIKSIWDAKASEHGQSYSASWGDIHCIKLEIDNIASFIQDGDSVLDIGCANGYSAIAQCERHKLSLMTGVDYSEIMITYANQNKEESKYSDILNFEVSDIKSLPFDDNTFDLAYTTRVLINLSNWKEQQHAISECLRVIKKGGRLILSEAFWEPLTNINAVRAIVGLPSLVEHDFNRYIKKSVLEHYIKELGHQFTNIDFSSIYYIGSRLFRELVTDYNSFEGYFNPINNDFYELQKKYLGGNLGIQQLYVIEKS